MYPGRGCPISVSVAASFSMLFDTQIKGRMGSPSVAGSTRRLSAGTSSGSFAQSARRPPPARRTRPFGSACPSRSFLPRLIVERASPVISETTARPPRPRSAPQPPQTGAPPARQAASPPCPIAAEPRSRRSCDRPTPLRSIQESPQPESIRRKPPFCDSVIVRSVLRAGLVLREGVPQLEVYAVVARSRRSPIGAIQRSHGKQFGKLIPKCGRKSGWPSNVEFGTISRLRERANGTLPRHPSLAQGNLP
jgi:hypothetical protein